MKTRPISFRINTAIYKASKDLAEDLGLSFAEIIGRALSMFISNDDPLKVKSISSEKDLVFRQLEKNPGISLKNLREKGIASTGEVLFLADLMNQAYRNGKYVNAQWLANMVQAFHFLVNKIENLKDLMPYFLQTFPQKEKTLNEKIKESIITLKKSDRIFGGYAELVARCFLVAVRDGKFELDTDEIQIIRNHLEPWCFWVSLKGLNKSSMNTPLELDITLLDRNKQAQKDDKVIVKPHISIRAIFSYAGSTPFHAGKKNFSCVISLIDPVLQKTKAILACNAVELYELIQVVGLTTHDNEINFGQWLIGQSVVNDNFYIRRHGSTTFYLNQEAMANLIGSVNDLANDKDVQSDLIAECLELYGAL